MRSRPYAVNVQFGTPLTGDRIDFWLWAPYEIVRRLRGEFFHGLRSAPGVESVFVEFDRDAVLRGKLYVRRGLNTNYSEVLYLLHEMLQLWAWEWDLCD